jgi:hypothetical protein
MAKTKKAKLCPYAKALIAVLKAADDIGFPPLYRELEGANGTVKALHIALAKLKSFQVKP